MDTKKLTVQLKYFFSRLTSEPRVGGLHISDSALLYADVSGGLKNVGVKLTPGVIADGKVVDAAKLLAAFQQLHKALEENEKKIVPVTISLPMAGIYTQSFTTPNVGREKLAESATLNLQMISPMSLETSYMSWQVLTETPDQFELLGAFADKKFVDDIRAIVEQAYFSPVAFEFPSLSIVRLVGLMGIGDTHPALLLQVTSDGLNFSIVRNNGLYFDYFRSWRSIQGADRQISRAHFEEVVVGEIQKVMNFTVSKFKESPKKLFMVAPGFENDVQELVKGHFDLGVAVLRITTWNVSSQWYAAIGAALRMTETSRMGEAAISLAPEEVGSFFSHEQALNFVRLWRSITIGVMGILLVLFGGSAYALARELESAGRDFAIFSANTSLSELATLRQSVTEFNGAVARISAVRSGRAPWEALFGRVNTLAAANGVILDRIDATSIASTITVYAHVPAREAVISFKNALAGDTKNFSNVELLVSQITTQADGSAGFQLTFRFVGTAQ